MKTFLVALYLVLFDSICCAQIESFESERDGFYRISIESRISGLDLSLLHRKANPGGIKDFPVLFVHGASFPSALAFGFRMNGYSWMDQLAEQGYQVFALDHLGYGDSDRYTQMLSADRTGAPLGKGLEVVLDIERAIEFILKRTGAEKIHLIGHSWGATVSGVYAARHPKQIQHLVLFAPFVTRNGQVDWTKPNYPYLELAPEKRVAQFFAQLPVGEDTVLEEEVVSKWGQTWLLSDAGSQIENRNDVRYPAGWKMDLYRCWTGECLFDPGKVTVPTLVIRGEWDTSFSSEDAQWLFENLNRALTKRYVLLEKSTHVAHLEKSRDQLYAEVELFLSEQVK